MEKVPTKKLIGVVTFAIVLFTGLQHLPAVMNGIGTVLGLLSPFLIGGCVAFILNVPMRFLERTLFGRARGKWQKARRPLSLVLTLALLVLVLWGAARFILPELARSVGLLSQSLPEGAAQIKQWAAQYADRAPDLVQWVEQLDVDWQSVLSGIGAFLQRGVLDVVSTTLGAALSVISGLVTAFIGFVFALYVLSTKEKLARQAKMLLYAYLPENRARRAVEIGRLTEKTFASFLSGQCLEALILGGMFVVALWALGFPYAVLIGVTVALTALVPIFGAFVGCIVGAFMILMVNPVQAFWFIVVFLALQQLEENLIYPRVVGHSVRLPSLWVLVAVTLGGSTLGIVGMLVNIPLFSILYTLLGEHAKGKLADKGKDAGAAEHGAEKDGIDGK